MRQITFLFMLLLSLSLLNSAEKPTTPLTPAVKKDFAATQGILFNKTPYTLTIIPLMNNRSLNEKAIIIDLLPNEVFGLGHGELPEVLFTVARDHEGKIKNSQTFFPQKSKQTVSYVFYYNPKKAEISVEERLGDTGGKFSSF